MASPKLQAKQAHALFDVLTHNEVYAEIREFRFPGALDHYGPPFNAVHGAVSSSPALQTLLSKFVLQLPGLRDVDDSYWKDHVAALIGSFEDADLSESYDKGHIGIRRTVATAISALIEYLVRGVFGGFDEPTQEDLDRHYDVTKSEDLHMAFRDTMHQVVYGSLIDDLISKIEETDNLADHTPQIQATHEYILVNLASFLHYSLIISPKGQSMLALVDSVNKLIPYMLVKQTLRIGNVASMINAMMRIILAKMSMGSVSNWMGWTSGADEGMNLLQHIISQVLHWEIRDYRHKASKIEKDKHGPGKECLDLLKGYLIKTSEEHEEIRNDSRSHDKSIVSAILTAESPSPVHLTDAQHQAAQEYLALQLAIRDREQITKVLCRSQPDHLTQAIRVCVNAYEPVIRLVHKAVDLSATVTDFEVFLKDLIKVSKISEHHGKHSEPPTVGDFVQLLRKHRSSVHRFLHQATKNGKELTSWFRDYILAGASNFRRTATNPPNPPSKSAPLPHAGDLTASLDELFQTLSEEKQKHYVEVLDQHAAYLDSLHTASANRLQAVVDSPPSKHPVFHHSLFKQNSASLPGSRSASPGPTPTVRGLEADAGPGAFLARWQSLLDASEITPSHESGHVRTGSSFSVLKAGRVGADTIREDGDAEHSGDKDSADTEDSDDEDVFEEAHEKLDQAGLPEAQKRKAPDVKGLVEELLPGFREILAKKGQTW